MASVLASAASAFLLIGALFFVRSSCFGLDSLGGLRLDNPLSLAHLSDSGLATTKLFRGLITSLVNPIGLILGRVGNLGLFEHRSHFGLELFDPWSKPLMDLRRDAWARSLLPSRTTLPRVTSPYLATEDQHLTKEITECRLMATTEPSQSDSQEVCWALSQRKVTSVTHFLSISREEVTPLKQA